MRKISAITESMCPQCGKVIRAEIVEEDGAVFMEKTCADHGHFKSLISKYAWYYKGLNGFYDTLFPKGHVLGDATVKILQFYPTTRCNLKCPICFSQSGSAGESERDLSLSEIQSMIGRIKGKKRIGILGGEPTVRDDLPEIIRMFSRAGHRVYLYTNGLRFVDPAYLESVCRSGVECVWIWIDAARDSDVCEKLRGEELYEKKMRALGNLKAYKVNTGVINVVVRGVNEHEILPVIDYCRRNRFISSISLRGYSHIGEKGFSPSCEFVMDEFIEMLQQRTGGLLTLEEFFLFQKLTYIMRAFSANQPQCYVCQYVYVPRGNGKRIRDIFPPDRFNRYLDEFIEIYRDSPKKAKWFFFRKLGGRLAANLPFFAQMIGDKAAGRGRIFQQYILLETAMFYTPHTIDLGKVRSRCTDAWLPDYADGKFVDFCSILSSREASRERTGH